MAWIDVRYRVTNGKKTKEKLYYVVDRDINHKPYVVEACGPDFDLAEKVKKAHEGDLVRRQHGLPTEAKAVTLATAIGKFYIEKSKKNTNTLIRYKWALDKLLEHCGPNCTLASLLAEGNDTIAEFKEKIIPEHCVNGIRNVIKFLSGFFNFCVKNRKWIPRNPMSGLLVDFPAEVVAHFLTDAEVGLILSCVTVPDFRDIIETALRTGMRQAELCKFSGDWLQGTELVIYGKGKKFRRIPIFPDVLPFIQRHDPQPGVQVFQGWSTNRIKCAWRRTIARARKKSPKLPRIRFHDLRHTFASNLLKGGSRLHYVKEFLGHSSLSTTMIYSHLETQSMHNEMAKLQTGWATPKLKVLG